MRPRVLIADDHRAVTELLRSLLEDSYDVVGIVTDGRQLLEQAPKLMPDVVVLDVSMPLLNGMEAAEQLKPLLPSLKFVFITMNHDPSLAEAALTLGPVGYVLKSAAAKELTMAVSNVLHGKPYLTSGLRPRKTFE